MWPVTTRTALVSAPAPGWTLRRTAGTRRRPPHGGQNGGDPEPELELGTLLSQVKAEAVCWLWPARIPRGKLTIIDGDPGLGKSVLTLDLAARISRGQPMPFVDREPGEDVVPAGVVLLTAEDGLQDTVRPRLDAAGANPGAWWRSIEYLGWMATGSRSCRSTCLTFVRRWPASRPG